MVHFITLIQTVKLYSKAYYYYYIITLYIGQRFYSHQVSGIVYHEFGMIGSFMT